MLKNYPVVAVLWRDHTVFRNAPLDKKVDITPSLTVGVLYEEDDESYTILSHLERLEYGGDLGDYTVIFKGTVIGKPKQFGEIELSLEGG